jgi:TetR/AcrR family transcriptional regulator, cholesterol catabolism regulator
LELQERILLKGDELFRRFGIRSITMDDIAKQLGVSKKTIYQHFPDKDELVIEMTKLNIGRHFNEVEKCCGPASINAIAELFAVNNSVGEMIRSFNPIMFYDLQKYHPKAWLAFREFRNKYVYEKIVDNMKRGIEEGFYRSDFDIEILAKMRLEQVDMTFNYDVFPPTEFQFSKVMEELTFHFLYGMVNEKGFELITQYKNTTV